MNVTWYMKDVCCFVSIASKNNTMICFWHLMVVVVFHLQQFYMFWSKISLPLRYFSKYFI